MFSEILEDSQEICDISKNTFYYRIPLVPASKNTLPSRIDVTSWQLIFWELSTLNSVISATTFIKNGPNFTPPCLFQAPHLLKSRNQVLQLPIIPLFHSSHHSKLENVFDFHIKVWKMKLLNTWLCTQKNKSFECGIVINCTQKYSKENRKQAMNIL